MDDDQARIRSPQNVGLRQTRPVARARHGAERKVRRKRLHREVRHRLEHRHLDERARTGPAPLHQGAQNPIRGIDPGHGVRERRSEKLRVARIDHNAQKPAERLGNRVVARALRIGSAAAETTDGAVDEPWVELLQALGTRAQTLRGAGPEVLDEYVGLMDEAFEHLPIGGALEVERNAALVAVVGLKVRRIAAALVAAVGIALRALDLDDIGTEVGEHHSGAWAGDEGALLYYSYSLGNPRATRLDGRAAHGFGVAPAGASPS